VNKRVIQLNSSALRRSACKRRLAYTLAGYREIAVGNDIVFGTCFHEFVARYRVNGADLNDAITVGWAARDREPHVYTKLRREYLNDINFFKQVCLLWTIERSDWTTMCVGGEHLVEMTWAIPFYEGEFVEIVLVGTIDDVCTHNHNEGVMAIRDYKTTSVKTPDEYFDKYRMSLQLMFYYFGMNRSCELNSKSSLAQQWLRAPARGAFIEGVFIDSKPMATRISTSQLFEFSAERLHEFELQLREVCRSLDHPEDHEFPREGLVNAACESEGYGRKCAFFDACCANSRENHDAIMRSSFSKETYSPLEP